MVWFGGRRTAIATAASNRSEAIAKTKKKLKRGDTGKVVTARRATADEQKLLNKGVWVRTGPNGQKPGFGGMRGKGPAPKKK